MTINYYNLHKILNDINNYKSSRLLIVTKKQNSNDIQELISKGFKVFGENRVQEAKEKYDKITDRDKIDLHLIGPLQTNKVKDALKLFNTIQSIDREKLVNEISKVLTNLYDIKTKSYFLQVNIGAESQKTGIDKSQCYEFYNYALEKKLNIVGLMCIPPNLKNVTEFFIEMNEIRKKINPNLKLSMGMSNDYLDALNYNSNLIRIGSLIFND